MKVSDNGWVVEPVDDNAFLSLARKAKNPVPIEQTPLWDRFDKSVEGREPWMRLALRESGKKKVRAVIALTMYTGRGFCYLWAKHGPVWITAPTQSDEKALRKALRSFVLQKNTSVSFIRLHAAFPASDLHELLQTITYDRTVQVDLTAPSEKRLADLSRSTRKKLRKVQGDKTLSVRDETDISAENFAELYAIHQETAARGEFGIFGRDVYHGMLKSLAPHARLFVVRRTHEGGPNNENKALAWLISTSFDGGGVNYYSAANHEGRACNAPLLLRWHAMETFAKEGVITYDFMGVDSPRSPSLKGVGDFKRQFGPEVEVEGAWDVPIIMWRYQTLKAALRIKKFVLR